MAGQKNWRLTQWIQYCLLLMAGCVITTIYLHGNTVQHNEDMARLKKRIEELESRTEAIKDRQAASKTTSILSSTTELSTSSLSSCHYRYEGYNLPFLPSDKIMNEALKKLSGKWIHVPDRGGTPGKVIPKYIWQTMKEIPPTWPPFYISGILKKNPKHLLFVMNDTDVDHFMTTVFADTSLLWTYRKINPKLGAMKADIWRYAVLYIFGGVYIDTDSSFDLALDTWLKPGDGFVVAPENNDYAECYHPNFYLHSGLTASGNSKFLSTLPFDKRKLVQWLLISRPRHPVMLEALRNIVAIVTQLYLRQPLMADPSSLGKNVVCSTGSFVTNLLLTYLIIVTRPTPNTHPNIFTNDENDDDIFIYCPT